MGIYRKFKEVSEENISKDPEYVSISFNKYINCKLLFSYLIKDMDAETICSCCDTVFNATLAEVDQIYDECVQDFQKNTKEYLDGPLSYMKRYYLFNYGLDIYVIQ